MPPDTNRWADNGNGLTTLKLSQKFARNAPSQTPGQTRWPYNSKAAKAMPDGGHSAGAFFSGGSVSSGSSRAAATYKAARASTRASHRSHPEIDRVSVRVPPSCPADKTGRPESNHKRTSDRHNSRLVAILCLYLMKRQKQKEIAKLTDPPWFCLFALEAPLHSCDVPRCQSDKIETASAKRARSTSLDGPLKPVTVEPKFG